MDTSDVERKELKKKLEQARRWTRRGLIDRMARADRSKSIREVPSWQVRPNGVMSLLSASWRSPDQMGRA
jgi:hypothetical protein